MMMDDDEIEELYLKQLKKEQRASAKGRGIWRLAPAPQIRLYSFLKKLFGLRKPK